MGYLILFILSFSVLFLIKNVTNKLSWIFFTMFIGISLMLFASVIYVTKLSNYQIIFSVDNYIFMFLNRLRINFYDIIRILNTGIALYLITMYCFVYYFQSRSRMSVPLRTAIFVLAFFSVVFYVWSNSPEVGRDIYFALYSAPSPWDAGRINTLIAFLQGINYAILSLALLLPLWVLLHRYRLARVRVKKLQALLSFVCLVFIDAFFFTLLFFGPFRNITLNSTGLLKFNSVWNGYWYTVYALLCVIVFVILGAAFYLMSRYKLLDPMNFMRKRAINRNAKLLANDLKAMLHSHKNTLLSIEILADRIKECYGNDEGFDKAEEIRALSHEAVSTMSVVLNLFNRVKVRPKNMNLIQCIHQALDKVNVPPEVRIVNQITTAQVPVYGDDFHITEMFANILRNALEAIKIANRAEGEIVITYLNEENWVQVDITDNGCGIAKKDRSKVFKPLYSTKNNHRNWGVGLTHISNVASAHLGAVFIKSAVNKYTRVQVCIPMIKEADIYG